MNAPLPKSFLQIRSTLNADGTLEIALAEAEIVPPGDDQVVIRIEASPINPSDLIPLLADCNPAEAKFAGTAERPVVTLQLPPELRKAAEGRVGMALTVGLEGAGVVVAAGKNAEGLLGQRVAALTVPGAFFGQYCTVSMLECMKLPGNVSSRQGAGLFCNPLTALAIVETLHQTGQKALIHTAAASNLGQMLVRICKEDGIPLVNIVRRPEHVALLRKLGAEYVCDSSAPGFAAELAASVRATGAMVAFDAIGGGSQAGTLLAAMEAAAVERAGTYLPYGSSDPKRVYVYGYLDQSPTTIPSGRYGLIWGVEGWAMPPILAKAGAERTVALTQRVVAGITTTFASHFGHEISLAQALSKDAMLGYCAQATGQKYVINPQL